jgi:hypothetical protein
MIQDQIEQIMLNYRRLNGDFPEFVLFSPDVYLSLKEDLGIPDYFPLDKYRGLKILLIPHTKGKISVYGCCFGEDYKGN